MNDVIENCKIEGKIILNGINIYNSEVDIVKLRTNIGMVFQKPNPFPKSIYDNIIYAPKLHGLVSNKSESDDLVEKSLTEAGLFNEVKDRLNDSGTSLSGGQQQRVAIARALVNRPAILLADEPTGALDSKTGAELMELFQKLHNEQGITLCIVTHDSKVAALMPRSVILHDGRISGDESK